MDAWTVGNDGDDVSVYACPDCDICNHGNMCTGLYKISKSVKGKILLNSTPQLDDLLGFSNFSSISFRPSRSCSMPLIWRSILLVCLIAWTCIHTIRWLPPQRPPPNDSVEAVHLVSLHSLTYSWFTYRSDLIIMIGTVVSMPPSHKFNKSKCYCQSFCITEVMWIKYIKMD